MKRHFLSANIRRQPMPASEFDLELNLTRGLGLALASKDLSWFELNLRNRARFFNRSVGGVSIFGKQGIIEYFRRCFTFPGTNLRIHLGTVPYLGWAEKPCLIVDENGYGALVLLQVIHTAAEPQVAYLKIPSASPRPDDAVLIEALTRLQ